MGKQRKFGVAVRVALVVAIASVGLIVAASSAQAEGPEPTTIVPLIDRACPSTANSNNFDVSWGYTNNGAQLDVPLADGTDDLPAGDHDDDDNLFFPTPIDRGQPTTFLANTSEHFKFTTPNVASGLTWYVGSHNAPLTGAVDCADLLVTKTQAVDTVTAGGVEQYTVTVKNLGPTSALNVVLSDALPTGAGSTSVTPSPACSVSGATVSCAPVTLALNATESMTITTTLSTTGSQTDTGHATTGTFDPNLTNNSASVSTNVAVPGGPTGGGVLNAGQQFTVADPAVNGTVKVQNGTVPVTANVGACPVAPNVHCKSEALNVLPHGTASGQVLTEVFDTGKPSPFVLIPFVKFFYFKDDLVDHPLPFCPHYLKPIAPANGTPCEYFRWMNLQGHAIVYVAFGAQDPRTHR